jgi:hypothetical protein
VEQLTRTQLGVKPVKEGENFFSPPSLIRQPSISSIIMRHRFIELFLEHVALKLHSKSSLSELPNPLHLMIIIVLCSSVISKLI